MNIFSDRSPGRAEAPEPGLNKPAATCAPSSLTAWCKPGLTRVSMAAKALPQQHETAPPLASVQLSDAAPADLQAGIQDLPHEILCQIFDYLPLSIHGQCALVCRHWHASLPTTRQRIARWLESLSPLQRLRIPPLAVGYSSRTGPFLARQRHKLFPAMQTQHQQLVRLQTARQQPDLTPGTQQLLRHKEQTACGLLSGLIGYSLQHHRFQEGQLSLKPVSWHPPPSEPVLTVDRSPCSRWLATRYQRDPGDPGIAAALRLYGWRDGGWHEERLVGAPVYPVTCTAFAERMLNTLFTMQGSEVFVWRLAATSGHWYAEKLYSVPSSYRPYMLVVSDEDDLIGLSRREGRAPGFHVQISICRADLQCWEHAPPQQYTRVPMLTTCRRGLGMLGLLWNWTKPGPYPVHTTSILIQGKGLDPASHGLWGAQLYTLNPCTPPVTRICLSPDGQHLLGLGGDKLCLWELDTQNKVLLKKRQFSCWPSSRHIYVTQRACFWEDGKQLLVACTPHQLQLWSLHENGDWIERARLEIPTTFDIHSDSQQRELCPLLIEQQTLGLRNADSMLVWQLGTDGQWQLLMERHNNRTERPAPPQFTQGCGTTIYTTANEISGAGTRLWIHASNLHGQFSKQVQMSTPGPLFAQSPDRLSLFFNEGSQVHCLQLVHPQDLARPQPEPGAH